MQKYFPGLGPARWLRHDAHLWIRHDAARWVKPGFDPADIYPTLKRKPDAAKAAALEAELAAEDAAFDAAIAASRRFLAVLRVEVDELKAELRRRRLEEAKYSPDQPRVPAGNPRGGRWTRIAGGIGESPSRNIAQPMGNVDVGNRVGSSETEGLFNPRSGRTDSANSSDGVLKVAAGDESGQRYSVNLEEEDTRGGHAKSKHVGKTDSELIDVLNADYLRRQSGNLEITNFREAEGSFASLEQANELVNQVLRLESEKVDNVAEGKARREKLEQKFDSITGKEAFRPNGDSDPYIRDTYSVRVVIKRDGRSPRGYTVVTAFPVN